MALICSGPLLMTSSSGLLQFYQESLEFRGVCVGIRDGRRKQVHDAARYPARIFLNSAEALMNRDSNLIDLLTVDGHGPDASRDHRFREIAGAGARHLHTFSAPNS